MIANIIRNAKKTATGGDPYYSAVSLLLSMDGSSGSTNFVDSGPNALAVTAAGNAQISTTQSKYGGASAYFDGTGDYLSFTGGMPSGSGTAFTIEFWMMLDAFSTYRSITRTAGGLDINVRPNGAIGCDQTSVAVIAASAAGVIIANTWYHVAVTRDTSNNYKLFVNGTQMGSGTNSFSVTAATTIGYSAAGPTVYFKGYIDDFRATNALRYTSSFTPPAQAHPNIYNPYTTLPVSGAALWLDASQQNTIFSDAGTTPVTTSGQSIYQWNDLSGNSRHAVQATSGNRPTWLPPASGQNGLGAVSFNGVNQYLLDSAAGINGSFTLYLVFTRNNAAGMQIPFEWGSYSTGDWRSFQSYYGSASVDGGLYFSGYFRDLTATSLTLAYNTASVMAVSFNGTNMTIQRDGGSTSGAVSLNSITSLDINIGRSVAGSNYLNGKICEAVLYGSAHDSTTRTAMKSYLKTKWGTP
jgi:hypothetical protein